MEEVNRNRVSVTDGRGSRHGKAGQDSRRGQGRRDCGMALGSGLFFY